MRNAADDDDASDGLQSIFADAVATDRRTDPGDGRQAEGEMEVILSTKQIRVDRVSRGARAVA